MRGLLLTVIWICAVLTGAVQLLRFVDEKPVDRNRAIERATHDELAMGASAGTLLVERLRD